MKKKQQSPMKFAVIMTVVVVFLIGALVVLNNQTQNASQTFDDKPSTEGQPLLGNKDATVTITEFGDYKCPSCKQWTETVFPDLKKDYIDKDQVNFSYINFVNEQHGRGSELSALASEQVWKEDPASFWKFHEALYKAQPDNDTMENEWATPAKLADITEANTKIKRDKLISSLNDKTFSEQLKTDNSLISKYSVDSTPTIFVNGVKIDKPFDYDKIKETIAKELKGQSDEK
ncbi:thioredoxin domain-containing protein [Bacillus paralicheniformis]|uniref:thioredoxin domain-containing protein n=1 Tax=Bacillus paralicheniformis TaxID=1648923 RepID=UPI00039A8C34|nr:thioredoxin domain-containing protein [Bacillus paralicheniformis]ETB71559.1 dihydroneopterin aldolase [Bacillus sp. CPSM8]MDU0413311.1 thioredoxin domain-containing protein [Bacillus paralicheniformis]MEC2210680.1 thioredoxin domain-containing protein [Bacillus paralicheniformis]